MVSTSRSAIHRARLLAGELGRPQEALEVLQDAIANDAENAQLWVMRAWAYQRLRDWRKAVEATEVAIHHDPRNEWAFRIMTRAIDVSATTPALSPPPVRPSGSLHTARTPT